jgi:hypothetical protein
MRGPIREAADRGPLLPKENSPPQGFVKVET